MNRNITTLLLVLLIQLMVTAAVFWPQDTDTKALAVYTLAAPEKADAINEIRIGDEDDNEALLQRGPDRWLLPQLENLPADPQMISRLLKVLTQSRQDWPVADTVAARQRFKVADYLYLRFIELSSKQQEVARIYLGTAPAFRKVHARRRSDSAIHSIDLNIFDAPADSTAWVDPALLQVRAPLRITGDGFSISRTDGQWRSGQQLQPQEHELMTLLDALRELRIDKVASEDMQRELALLEPGQKLQIESLSGNMDLELFAVENKRFIHSSQYPFFFQVSHYHYDSLAEIDFLRISGETTAQ